MTLPSPRTFLRRPWGLVLALTALTIQPVIFYWQSLINPRTHIPFDIQGFHLPLIAYIARSVREGVAPFWDPFAYCGVPIHADSQAQLFYPLNWIAIFLGNLSHGQKLYYWVEWLVPLHMILAGLFAFALLRHLGVRNPAALLGASVYQLGGFFASQAQHLGAISAGAWLPLAVLAAFRLKRGLNARWIAILALSVAMAVLAGFSAATVVVLAALGLVVIALLITRRASWKLVPAVACGVALGAAIAAVQLVPTYQLAKVSVAAMRSEWHITGGGLPLQSLASLIVPNYYHIDTPFTAAYKLKGINFTFLYVYCGIATVLLLAIAPFLKKKARMFSALTLVAAVWMLGEATPVYRAFYTHLPGFVKGALYAEYALMAFCFFAGITAALALDRLVAGRRQPVSRAVRLRYALLWAVALLTSADLIYFGAQKPMNSYLVSWKWETSEYSIKGAPGALERLRAVLDTSTPPVRIDYMDTAFFTGVQGSELVKLPTAIGDNPFMLKRYLLLRRLFCGGNPWERQIQVNRPGSPLLDMLNVGALSSVKPLSEEEVRRAGLQPLGVIMGLNIYRNPKALPRFFLVPRLHASGGLSETLARLASPDFRPAEEAVVEAPGNRGLDGPFASGSVHIDRYAANQVDLTVNAGGKAFLASSEPLYPGWTVTVNGKPAEFVLTNASFRGLFLEPGVNRIVMTYRPVALPLLAAISGLSLLAAIAMVFVKRPKKSGILRVGATESTCSVQ